MRAFRAGVLAGCILTVVTFADYLRDHPWLPWDRP